MRFFCDCVHDCVLRRPPRRRPLPPFLSLSLSLSQRRFRVKTRTSRLSHAVSQANLSIFSERTVYRVPQLLMHLGWVDFDLFPQLSSRCWQIPISPGRIGQTVEHSKFKSTEPRCMSRWATLYKMIQHVTRTQIEIIKLPFAMKKPCTYCSIIYSSHLFSHFFPLFSILSPPVSVNYLYLPLYLSH